LTSSGNTTLGTGASSINSIGSVTTPGTLTLHGATTLDNTFTVSGTNSTSLGGTLGVTGLASFSNASASSGFESTYLKTNTISNSTGTLTINALTLGGAITGNSQNITGLGTINGLAITADTGTITTGVWNGTAVDISSYTNLTAGTDLTLTGDDLSLDSTLTQAYSFSNTGSQSMTGSLTVSKGLAFPSGKITASGYLGIGTTSPTQALHVVGGGYLTTGLGVADTNITSGVVNVGTGFRIANAAASNAVLRGNGTNFVSSAAAALTKTDDTNVTLTLGGAPTTALLDAASLTLGWTGQLSLARGGTNANLTANTGGIFYSTATAGAILAGTATAGQMLRSGATAAPTWSTATFPATATGTGTILRADGTNWIASTNTFPDTAAISTILYASAANVISALATANNGVLITSATGVPSISSTIPTATQDNITRLGTIVSGVWNGTAVDISSYTNLTAGTDL
ncbi:MAG: hypothetical protein AAB857_03630, partial [Patescibacteria group bacterium]